MFSRKRKKLIADGVKLRLDRKQEDWIQSDLIDDDVVILGIQSEDRRSALMVTRFGKLIVQQGVTADKRRPAVLSSVPVSALEEVTIEWEILTGKFSYRLNQNTLSFASETLSTTTHEFKVRSDNPKHMDLIVEELRGFVILARALEKASSFGEISLVDPHGVFADDTLRKALNPKTRAYGSARIPLEVGIVAVVPGDNNEATWFTNEGKAYIFRNTSEPLRPLDRAFDVMTIGRNTKLSTFKDGGFRYLTISDPMLPTLPGVEGKSFAGIAEAYPNVMRLDKRTFETAENGGERVRVFLGSSAFRRESQIYPEGVTAYAGGEESKCFARPMDARDLPEKLIRRLPNELNPDEVVEIAVVGPGGQTILMTNNSRMIIFKSGMTAGVTGGEKLISWSFNSIQGIHSEMGLFSGYAALQVSGASVSDMSFWSSGSDDPHKASNAIPLVKADWERISNDISTIRRRIADYHHAGKTQPTPPQIVESSQRFCTDCGVAVPAGARFCGSCGSRIE